ncbi:Hypothetical protein, putative [Bodo saltans]|uniref:Uncharacterized protein n=1 Tax=Bodo saltans TaxID=75058 RepID=A0A0S4ILD5_BODSA|nr:Hypothetical protein, putative [Bodo saltans]|eukprot:CUE71374.1 Hypothetical protein, putative [Bodo saltans]
MSSPRTVATPRSSALPPRVPVRHNTSQHLMQPSLQPVVAAPVASLPQAVQPVKSSSPNRPTTVMDTTFDDFADCTVVSLHSDNDNSSPRRRTSPPGNAGGDDDDDGPILLTVAQSYRQKTHFERSQLRKAQTMRVAGTRASPRKQSPPSVVATPRTVIARSDQASIAPSEERRRVLYDLTEEHVDVTPPKKSASASHSFYGKTGGYLQRKTRQVALEDELMSASALRSASVLQTPQTSRSASTMVLAGSYSRMTSERSTSAMAARDAIFSSEAELNTVEERQRRDIEARVDGAYFVLSSQSATERRLITQDGIDRATSLELYQRNECEAEERMAVRALYEGLYDALCSVIVQKENSDRFVALYRCIITAQEGVLQHIRHQQAKQRTALQLHETQSREDIIRALTERQSNQQLQNALQTEKFYTTCVRGLLRTVILAEQTQLMKLASTSFLEEKMILATAMWAEETSGSGLTAWFQDDVDETPLFDVSTRRLMLRSAVIEDERMHRDGVIERQEHDALKVLRHSYLTSGVEIHARRGVQNEEASRRIEIYKDVLYAAHHVALRHSAMEHSAMRLRLAAAEVVAKESIVSKEVLKDLVSTSQAALHEYSRQWVAEEEISQRSTLTRQFCDTVVRVLISFSSGAASLESSSPNERLALRVAYSSRRSAERLHRSVCEWYATMEFEYRLPILLAACSQWSDAARAQVMRSEASQRSDLILQSTLLHEDANREKLQRNRSQSFAVLLFCCQEQSERILRVQLVSAEQHVFQRTAVVAFEQLARKGLWEQETSQRYKQLRALWHAYEASRRAVLVAQAQSEFQTNIAPKIADEMEQWSVATRGLQQIHRNVISTEQQQRRTIVVEFCVGMKRLLVQDFTLEEAFDRWEYLMPWELEEREAHLRKHLHAVYQRTVTMLSFAAMSSAQSASAQTIANVEGKERRGIAAAQSTVYRRLFLGQLHAFETERLALVEHQERVRRIVLPCCEGAERITRRTHVIEASSTVVSYVLLPELKSREAKVRWELQSSYCTWRLQLIESCVRQAQVLQYHSRRHEYVRDLQCGALEMAEARDRWYIATDRHKSLFFGMMARRELYNRAALEKQAAVNWHVLRLVEQRIDSMFTEELYRRRSIVLEADVAMWQDPQESPARVRKLSSSMRSSSMRSSTNKSASVRVVRERTEALLQASQTLSVPDLHSQELSSTQRSLEASTTAAGTTALTTRTSTPYEDLMSEGDSDYESSSSDEDKESTLYRDVSKVKTCGDLRRQASVLQLQHDVTVARRRVMEEEHFYRVQDIKLPLLADREQLKRAAIQTSEARRSNDLQSRLLNTLRAQASWEAGCKSFATQEQQSRQLLVAHQHCDRMLMEELLRESLDRTVLVQRSLHSYIGMAIQQTQIFERIKRREIAVTANKSAEWLYFFEEEAHERRELSIKETPPRAQFSLHKLRDKATIQRAQLQRTENAASQKIFFDYDAGLASLETAYRRDVELFVLAFAEISSRESILRRQLEHYALYLLDDQSLHRDAAVTRQVVTHDRESELHLLAHHELTSRETIARKELERRALSGIEFHGSHRELLSARVDIEHRHGVELRSLLRSELIAREMLIRRTAESDALFGLKFLLLVEAEAEARLDIDELSRHNSSNLRRTQSGHGLKSVERTEERTRRSIVGSERLHRELLSVHDEETVERWQLQRNLQSAVFVVAIQALLSEEALSSKPIQRDEDHLRSQMNIIEAESHSRIEKEEGFLAAHAARLQTSEFQLEVTALEEDALRTISELSQSSPQMLFEVLLPLCEEEELALRDCVTGNALSSQYALYVSIVDDCEDATRRGLLRAWDTERRSLWFHELSAREEAELSTEQSQHREDVIKSWENAWYNTQRQEVSVRYTKEYQALQQVQLTVTFRRFQLFIGTTEPIARSEVEYGEEDALSDIVFDAALSHVAATEAGIRNDMTQREASQRGQYLIAAWVSSLETIARRERVDTPQHLDWYEGVLQAAAQEEEIISRAAVSHTSSRAYGAIQRDAAHQAAIIHIREAETTIRISVWDSEHSARTTQAVHIIVRREELHRQDIWDRQVAPWSHHTFVGGALLAVQHHEMKERASIDVNFWASYLNDAASSEKSLRAAIKTLESRGTDLAMNIFDQLHIHHGAECDIARIQQSAFNEWMSLLLTEAQASEVILRQELINDSVNASAALFIHDIVVAEMEPLHRTSLAALLESQQLHLHQWFAYEAALCHVLFDEEPLHRRVLWNDHNTGAGVIFFDGLQQQECLHRSSLCEDEALYHRFPLRVQEHVALEECCRYHLYTDESTMYLQFLDEEDAAHEQAFLEQTLREELEACHEESDTLHDENEEMMSTLKACMVAFQELEVLKREEHTVVRAYKRANKERRRTEKVLLDFGDADRAEALVTYAEEDSETTQVVQRLWLAPPHPSGGAAGLQHAETISVSPHRSSTGPETPHIATPLFPSALRRASEDEPVAVLSSPLIPLPRYEFDAANIEVRAKQILGRLEAVDRMVAQVDESKHTTMDEVRKAATAFQDNVAIAFMKEMNVLESKSMLLRGVEDEVMHHVHRGTGTSYEPRPREAVEAYHAELAREAKVLLGNRSAEETAADVALATDAIVRLEIGLNALLAEMATVREEHAVTVRAASHDLAVARKSHACMDSDIQEMRNRSLMLRERHLITLAARNQQRLEAGKQRRSVTPPSSRRGTPSRTTPGKMTPRQGSATPRHQTPKTPKTPGMQTPRTGTQQPPSRTMNTPRALSTTAIKASSAVSPVKARASASPLAVTRGEPQASTSPHATRLQKSSASPNAPKRTVWR